MTSRKRAGVVERTRLESVRQSNLTKGSNPFVSAVFRQGFRRQAFTSTHVLDKVRLVLKLYIKTPHHIW